MAQNKILPWAQTSTSNALSDADYASAIATNGVYADGVKSGQASSKQANKTWRQATTPGAGLGQFLVDNLNVDVTDADTPATFSSRIANAVLKLSQISPFNQSWAVATGGYRKYAIVSDGSGNYWSSTADQNVTVPGASGANWQSLFNGYLPTKAPNAAVGDQPLTNLYYAGGLAHVWAAVNSTTYGSLAWLSDVTEGLAGKQPLLGFTPVQQGGGAGQATNKVILGWATDGSGLKCQVDSSDEGFFSFRGEINCFAFNATTYNSSSAVASFSFLPSYDGFLKLEYNAGQSSNNPVSSMDITGYGFTTIGGSDNHSGTNLMVGSLLVTVTSGKQVVLNLACTYTGSGPSTIIGGTAIYIPK